MMPLSQLTRARCSLFLILLLGASVPAVAQTDPSSGSSGGAKWGLIDAIGYGGLGFGLGVLATWDMESDDFGPPGAALVITGASTLAGTALGAVIGTRAERTIATGRAPGRAQSVAVMGGGILAGGTLGALTSAALIQGEGEGTFLGSDEQTFTLLVLAGGTLGSWYVWRHRDEFRSRSVSMRPEMTRNGEYGLRLVVAF